MNDKAGIRANAKVAEFLHGLREEEWLQSVD